MDIGGNETGWKEALDASDDNVLNQGKGVDNIIRVEITDPDSNDFHSTDVDFSAGSAKDFFSERFSKPRRIHANDGLITRMINGTDDLDSELDLTIIWSD